MFARCIIRQHFRPAACQIDRIRKVMSTSSAKYWEPVYHWQEDVEELEEYRSGGYHRIILDTILKDRCRIVHKLGFGSYSTVWLARDYLANTYVALKVLNARASKNSQEARILNHINRDGPGHLGQKFLMSLLDDFTVTGPNGEHTCIVSEALGPTVENARYRFTGDLLPLDVAKRSVVQLATGLAPVHSHGIVHGGESYNSENS